VTFTPIAGSKCEFPDRRPSESHVGVPRPRHNSQCPIPVPVQKKQACSLLHSESVPIKRQHRTAAHHDTKCLSIRPGFRPLWLLATRSRIADRFSPEESPATFGGDLSHSEKVFIAVYSPKIWQRPSCHCRGCGFKPVVVAMIPEALIGNGEIQAGAKDIILERSEPLLPKWE
jgi:hypothetical protein